MKTAAPFAKKLLLSATLVLLAPACASVSPQSKGAAKETGDDVAAPAPSFVQADFMGKEAEALDALLGTPGLIRREGEGEFRRYGLPSCMLIVILYPDEEGVRRAAHLDAAALTSGEEKPDLDNCLGGESSANGLQS